jgi:methionyl-tRNA formyltransferase
VNQRCSGALVTPKLEGSGIPFVDVIFNNMNTTETQTLIEAQRPDILVVCGGPILQENIFAIPQVAAINIHWGIAPAFRGAESTFWALLKSQWDGIGITIHKIDPGIDTGAHLAQGTPRLEPTDDEVSLWVKNSCLAVRLILDVLAADDDAIRSGGMQPEGSGHCYRYRDHRWWHDVQLWIRSWSRRYRPPHREPREVHYVARKG